MADASRAELLGGGAPDLVAWWSALGQPGYEPDADVGTTFPFAYAGHVRGAWSLIEPVRGRLGAPFPGVLAGLFPLGFTDTVTVDAGPGAAWAGFESALREVRTGPGPAAREAGSRPRARGDFGFVNGTAAVEEYALGVERGDSLDWLRAETAAWNRGGIGALGDAGRHAYTIALGLARGTYRADAAYTQRGSAASLASGEEQSATGDAGHVGWEVAAGPHAFFLRGARGTTVHESFGGLLLDARREAQQSDVEAGWRLRHDRWPVEARLQWTRAEVVRLGPGASDLESHALWGALRTARRLGDGRLEAAVGVGRHGGVDRLEAAPTLAYVLGSRAIAGRLVVERVLAPVWTDLAPGQGAFLQSTWTAGLELQAAAKPGRARLGWRMGRTRDRAVVERAPFEELWLRSGFYADPDRYDFGLLTAAVDGTWRAFGAGVEGYALARGEETIFPRVDPARGGRAWLETRGRLFADDLAVRVRLEAAGIGPRESEAYTRLPGYVSFGFAASFTLADAVVTVSGRNLEDRRRRQVWLDPATGEEALGLDREMRFSLTWRMFN